MTIIDIILTWFAISILLYIILGLCVNEPGSTNLGDKLFFIIIAILGLPVTIIGLTLVGLFILYMRKINKI